MKFKVEYIVHKDPGPHKTGDYVYSVEFPYLPGCATDARTLREAHKMAREAATLYIECQLEHHPDEPLFRYDPWDWVEEPGEKFEMVIRLPSPSPSVRPRRRDLAALMPALS